jgi:hypothetical protein
VVGGEEPAKASPVGPDSQLEWALYASYSAALGRNPKTKFSLPIADCRLTIEKVLWQLLPMFISNRKSAIENRQFQPPWAKR